MSFLPARSRALPTASLIAALLLLVGCAAPAGDHDDDAHDDRTQAETTIVEDAWAKAADGGMTSAFAVLSNDGHHDVHLIGASTTAASAVELHEVVADGGASTMREVEGGFVVPVGGTLVLEPGGLHLMLMGLAEPLRPGAEIEIALEFDDGSTQAVVFVVKDFAGADEDYEGEH